MPFVATGVYQMASGETLYAAVAALKSAGGGTVMVPAGSFTRGPSAIDLTDSSFNVYSRVPNWGGNQGRALWCRDGCASGRFGSDPARAHVDCEPVRRGDDHQACCE